MCRRTWLLVFLFSALLLFTPAALAKSKPKTSNTGKIERDFARFTLVPGAETVGAEQCTQCHTDLAKGFRHSPHSIVDVTCEQCHGAGSLHVAEGAYTKEKIISFRDRPADDANGVCLSCHAKSDHVRNWFAGAHQAQDIKCSDCHTIHEGASKPRMALASGGEVRREPRPLESRREMNDKCLQCHRKQDAQANLPYHHPIREAKMSCVDCHDPHGGSAGNNLKASNTSQLCLQCHEEYQGPFSFQHPPVTEDCMKCHSPHGSPNQNMLVVSQPALCLQCHSAHHNGASTPIVDRCTNCHNSIHGTDIPSAVGGALFIDK
jgi:DmsE family decaheme c-type cytochrome